MPGPAHSLAAVSRLPSLLRLARVTLGLAVLCLAGSLLSAASNSHGGVSVIWLSNGLLIGVLLCTPRRQWPAFLAIGYLVDFTTNIALHTPVGLAAYLSFCNMEEVVVASALMFPAIAPKPDFTEVPQMASLLLYGVLVAPASAALLTSIYFRVAAGAPFISTMQFWFAADVLGIATVTPLYLSYHYRQTFLRQNKGEALLLFIALAVASTIVFGVVTLPMLWVVLLFLVMLGIRLGFTGAALGLLMVSLIGGYLTVTGYGPLSTATHFSTNAKILTFQAFIGVSMLALYLTEVSRARATRMRLKLEASETRFRLLAEASRDIIVLADLDGRRQYVSPAMTELLGWTEDELKGHDPAEIVHPDDLPRLRRLFADCKRGEENLGSLSYQSKKRDGSFLWLEVNVRLFRAQDTGEPAGFVYILRDVSQRKAAEDELQEAFLLAQKLAMVDGLTGVANRRLLDETLDHEWQRATREHAPFSVLLIDVDFFKRYNDLYGHLEGDLCLQRVARSLQKVLKRPQDLLARYGGEEFVVVLPSTPRAGAELISERIRETVEACAIPHGDSPHEVVTVSVGCATTIPSLKSSPSELLKSADAALYVAKSTGRNRMQADGAVLEV